MKVVFISPSTLHYKGKKYLQGDELEITETFYNANHTRFEKIDNNFVMDAEFEEVTNVKPVEIKNVKPKVKRTRNGK